MDFRDDPLWKDISNYKFDDPAASVPFSRKLAHEEKWSMSFTLRAIGEYRHFMYLCCISPTGASPSVVVDKVWHMHLTYTVDYWQRFCRDTLHKNIHHHPSSGGPGEQRKHDLWYLETLKLYRATFGEAAPADVWPVPQALSADFTAGPKTGVKKMPGRYAVLIVPFALILILYGWPNPFQLAGPHFLVFYAALMACGLTLPILYRRDKSLWLKEMLRHYDGKDVYELAYLAGGQHRLTLLHLSSLISEGVLTYVDKGRYAVDLKKAVASKSPLAPELLLLNMDVIAFPALVSMSNDVSGDIAARVNETRKAFTGYELSALYVPIGIGIIGIARVIEGAVNDKPTGSLIMLIVLYFLATRMVLRIFDFHKICERAIRKQWRPAGEEKSLEQQIVISGAAALYGFMMFNHLRQNLYDTSRAYGSGGCGGGSCGGGCGGGGCGGCGGH